MRRCIWDTIKSRSLSSHTLFIVLVISLLVSIFCSTYILRAYFHRNALAVNFRTADLNRNVESALNFYLNTAQGQTGVEIDLFGEGKDSVLLNATPWGLYEVLNISAFRNKNIKQKSALLGAAIDSNSVTLNIADNNRPISLSGKTVIKGNVRIPKSGVKRGYIEGQSFMGNTLIEGEIGSSELVIKPFENPVITAMMDFTAHIVKSQAIDTVVLLRSFKDSTLYVGQDEFITLENMKAKGNIIISSTKGIIVKANAVLENVILAAPYIYIQGGFVGALQAFATDSIHVGSGARLLYPSVLALEKSTVGVQPNIVIESRAKILGEVLLVEKTQDRFSSLIHIHTNAQLIGRVFTNGYITHSGDVFGKVTCNKFYLKTPSSVYENHLLNAVIDWTRLPQPFGFGLDNSAISKKELIQWVY